MAFSRRLGYRSNVCADWEQGLRAPTAAETLRAARVAGHDVEAVLAAFHAPSAGVLGQADAQGVAAWLRVLQGASSVSDVARRAGVSRHAAGRWLSGRSQPRLPDFLRLIDVLTHRVSDFLVGFVPITSVPQLQVEHEQRHAARALATAHPWSFGVLVVLETQSYQGRRHEDAWVADWLGLEVDVVRRCLEALRDGGVIAWDGARWHPRASVTIDTTSAEARSSLRQHWTGVAAALAADPGPDDVVSYNLFSVSRTDLQRIRDAQRAFFREVRGIVAASSPAEEVALLCVELVTWPGRLVGR